MSLTLRSLATARSGDKGDHANIAVVANDAAAYEQLVRWLTAERVAHCFRQLGTTRVERFELPQVQALNFLLYNVLAGGASRSLRLDTQGKLLGTVLLDTALLDMVLPDLPLEETAIDCAVPEKNNRGNARI